MAKDLQIGCYVDGNCRNTTEGDLALISLAESFGMPTMTYKHKGMESDDAIEEIESAGDEAEAWLNEHKTLPYASWYWHEGDFGLWPETNWNEYDGDDCIRVNEVPSYIMHVNERGNTTLYEIVEKKEVWSVV